MLLFLILHDVPGSFVELSRCRERVGPSRVMTRKRERLDLGPGMRPMEKYVYVAGRRMLVCEPILFHAQREIPAAVYVQVGPRYIGGERAILAVMACTIESDPGKLNEAVPVGRRRGHAPGVNDCEDIDVCC